MKKWNCCIEEPYETGKIVLCHKDGYIYVAMRIKNYYIPTPFADHYYCKDLCHPDQWQEIDFPEGVSGHFELLVEGGNFIRFSEAEVDYPENFNDLCSSIIYSIGTLKRD